MGKPADVRSSKYRRPCMLAGCQSRAAWQLRTWYFGCLCVELYFVGDEIAADKWLPNSQMLVSYGIINDIIDISLIH